MSNKVMHTYSDHLITRQNRAEKEFLAAFEAEKPTLENAHVLLHLAGHLGEGVRHDGQLR